VFLQQKKKKKRERERERKEMGVMLLPCSNLVDLGIIPAKSEVILSLGISWVSNKKMKRI
jgi:hypothetical protein